MRDAFEKFINRRDNKPAELIAKFMDAKLRGGGKERESSAELEGHLNRALELFRFIQARLVPYCTLCMISAVVASLVGV